MNQEALEAKIASALANRVDLSTVRMPRGTVWRIRGRQVVTIFVAAGLASLLTLGVVGGLSAARRPQHAVVPGAPGLVPDAASTTPAPEEDFSPSFTPFEDTRPVRVTESEPYRDQHDRQMLYLMTQVHVVAYGDLRGVEWSLAGYQTHAYTGDAWTHFEGGPCGDLFLGDLGSLGGATFCLNTERTPPDARFALMGLGIDAETGLDRSPLVAYAGVVGNGVAMVQLRLDDGTIRELALHDGPEHVPARFFSVFVDETAAGRIVALAADGSLVGEGRLCLGRVPGGPEPIACGNGVMTVATAATGNR